MRAEKENILLVDTGNCLSGQPLTDMSKGHAMAESMDMMGYDAMALGSVDFGVGWEPLRDLSREVRFPFLSANLAAQGLPRDSSYVKPYAILEVGPGEAKEKVAVIGLSGTADFGKLAREKTGDLVILDPLASLEPVLKEVREETGRVILLSNLTREEDIAVAAAYPDIDVIIGAQAPLFQMAAIYVRDGEATTVGAEGRDLTGGTLIVAGLDKGRSLCSLDIVLDAEGGIAQFEYKAIALSPKLYDEDAEVASLLLSYENEMLKDDARETVTQWRELTKGDYSHLRNLASVQARGEEGIRAYEEGNYKRAAELITTAKDSLLIRESAREEWEKFQRELARGVPEGLKTTKALGRFEEGKRLYGERQFTDAKKKFSVAIWTLEKMRRIAEGYDAYLREKDSLAEDGIDLSMDEKSLAHYRKALEEENFDDALSTLQRANMNITQGKTVRKWRKIMDRITSTLGESVSEDSAIAMTNARADSAYLKKTFTSARMKYNRVVKMLEPMVEKAGIFSGPQAPVTREGDRYVGSFACMRCHEEEYGHWEGTLHSKAFIRMDENARLDPACVKCHVVGFGSEDGFRITEPDSGLAAVGCESCHGRGYLHTQSGDPSLMSPGYAKEMCLTCHDPEQGFELDYFPLLVRVMHR